MWKPFIYQWNARYNSKSTLRWAVRHGNEYTARMLDEVAPEGIDDIEEKYWEMLSSAASNGHGAIVRTLLGKGVSPALYKALIQHNC